MWGVKEENTKYNDIDHDLISINDANGWPYMSYVTYVGMFSIYSYVGLFDVYIVNNWRILGEED